MILMQRLIEGVHRSHPKQFGHYRALFKKLFRQGQRLETLFMTCSDSHMLGSGPQHPVWLVSIGCVDNALLRSVQKAILRGPL